MDRSIILTSDKDAMFASVLNPVPAVKGRGAGSSIIPFLTRPYADQMEVEALVRPRMPVLMTAPELDAYVDEDEEVEDEDMADDSYNAPKDCRIPEATCIGAPATEESTPQKQDVQTKKARFDEIIPATSSQQPFSQTAPAITKTEAPKLSTHVTTTSTTVTAQAPQEAVEDSDDELPTLNIESDTDEEDDDVTMEG
ncbi:hypothetical protein N7519_006904 [Penicillium mononematosum]|uniref:uncharacterized protein n=1 Tax=Penicillium mononematosum TaxID=268346 RepID=UPI002547F6E2|nr:uncharacterized protein N7519_006904 [Penicillium mononematosum]KAJ6185603.1 hypothetical protein N7519_006904 [Penicillium mononematosum]